MTTVKDLFKIKPTKSVSLNKRNFLKTNNSMYLVMNDSRDIGPQWVLGKRKLNNRRAGLDNNVYEEESWA